MRSLLACALVLASGCHKDPASPDQTPAPGEPASTAEADALWKLAPAGAMLGVVATPRSLAMIEHGWQDVHAFIATVPELAPVAAELSVKLAAITGGKDFAFATLGLTTTKGTAIFVAKNGEALVVVPLADRDAFLAAVHGTKGDQQDTVDGAICKTTHGVYACGSTAAILDLIGSGTLTGRIGEAKARGDVEMVARDLPMGNRTTTQAVVMQLARGAVTVRGTVTGLPKEIMAQLGAASRPRTNDEHATGFGLIHVKSILDAAPLPPEGEAFVKSIEDPITATSHPGGFDLQVPLASTDMMKAFVEHCDATPLARFGAKVIDGGCRMQLPNMPGVTVDAWIDGKVLHAGTKGVSGGARMTSLGSELAKSDWQIAFWGRGTWLASTLDVSGQLAKVPPEMLEPLRAALRGMIMLNEVGLGVRVDGDALHFVMSARTVWANPDPVVAKLVAIDPMQIVAGKGAELAKPIASSAPGSPFAADFNAGYSGMMMPMAVLGGLAAVAIPAFMDYMKKSKESEASISLRRIGMGVKRYYYENGSFPIGDAPLTPNGACCGAGPKNKCPADPKAWQASKIWSALEIEIDEPSLYQYRYHSDGKTVLVEAVGDVDCDTNFATWQLAGKVEAGNVILEPQRPPSGVY